jgi:phosphoglucomutase
MIDEPGGYTPTPVISHAILTYNRKRTSGLADGIVITPSHNPPSEGGFKYNPPNGGPADTDITDWIQKTANDLIKGGLKTVKRVPYAQARKSACIHGYDYRTAYIADLENVVDMKIIKSRGVKIGIDPLGGASVQYWEPIIDRYKIDATVVNDAIDPTFRFMTVDWDGQIRMDCSSPYAMKRLVAQRKNFDVAFANDTDADRHGIVCRSGGLMNPNHYLAVMVSYLFQNRPDWKKDSAVGKTVVSSGIIDRVAAKIGRDLVEVPVGFKWFVDGLIGGNLGFGGEESAGASFLRKDGAVWTTDKDGLIPGLLAAEMTAKTGHDPSQLFDKLTAKLGVPFYERIDAPASPEQKAVLKKLSPDKITAKELAGDKITNILEKAPGNGAAIGGIKVVTENGWFAARPSGTENVYKVYAESFCSQKHLRKIQHDAQAIVADVFKKGIS